MGLLSHVLNDRERGREKEGWSKNLAQPQSQTSDIIDLVFPPSRQDVELARLGHESVREKGGRKGRGRNGLVLNDYIVMK